MHEEEITGVPPCDFDRLCFEIRPCDVLLVEGRSRVSEVIKTVTQSVWTHSALYIGRLVDIKDKSVREHVSWLYDGDPEDHLIIEPLLGEGTIISPLKKYAREHLRICRPTGLSHTDSQNVIENAVNHLGRDYNVKQILDIYRFLLPYHFVPKRWRSSLFEHNAGESTRTVCSTMIANAFSSVHFPILPVVHKSDKGYRLYKRNTLLYTPRDFDYSPYFEIIKYPLLGLNDLAVYRQLPWDQNGVICNDENDCYIADPSGDTLMPDNIAVKPKPKLKKLKKSNKKIETVSKNTDDDEIVDAEFPTDSENTKSSSTG